MHMVSKKDLNKAELVTVKIPESPTMVMTANSEVLAKEEATENASELDLFVTVMLLENTLAVLSLEKLCEEFGYSYHWTSGQKPHLVKKGKASMLKSQFCCRHLQRPTLCSPLLVVDVFWILSSLSAEDNGRAGF